MKKSLIAMAVASAMATPVAMAEVTVYGRAQVELSQFSPDAANGKDKLTMVDNAMGRVNVKATDDFGNGWTGLAKFEFKADTADNDTEDTGCTAVVTDGTGVVDVDGNPATPGVPVTGTKATCTTKAKASLTGREAMVGLKGPEGQFELGRLQSPYKYTGGVKYDAFVGTSLEARADSKQTSVGASFPYSGRGMSGGDFGHGGFLSNTIGYRGKFGPVSAELVYGPSTDDGRYALSIKYDKDGIEAFVATADTGDSQYTTVNKKINYNAVKFGGSFKTGGHKIMLQLETADAKTAKTSTSADVNSFEYAWNYLAYHGEFGTNTFVVQVATNSLEPQVTDSKGKAVDDDATYMVLGVIHKFSKETRLFGGFRNIATENDSIGQTISVGLRKDF